MRLLPLLLFLSACGAPSHTYRQGIPVAPSAPAFNPAWDAPHTTGQPGYVGPVENLPRSPHGRVLPETPDTCREPGLWAGDQPRASADLPRLFGLVMPHSMDRKDVALGAECAAALEVAAAGTELRADLTSMDERLRVCVTVTMYANCVSTVTNKLAEALRSAPTRELDTQHVIAERLKWSALHYAEMRCKEVAVPDHLWEEMGDIEAKAAAFVNPTQARSIH